MYDAKVKSGYKTIPNYKIVKEQGIAYRSDIALSGPSAVGAYIKAIIGDVDREHAITLYLDMKNRVIGYEITSIGTINQCFMEAREVFRGAIMYGAASVIVAHNHPSGDTTPSVSDIEVTKNLMAASKILNIPLIDHIIVGDDYHSIRENNFQLWN